MAVVCLLQSQQLFIETSVMRRQLYHSMTDQCFLWTATIEKLHVSAIGGGEGGGGVAAGHCGASEFCSCSSLSAAYETAASSCYSSSSFAASSSSVHSIK